MGKSSNRRKAVRQSAVLVNECSRGGITVRATRAFPPELMPLVVHAFRQFFFGHVSFFTNGFMHFQFKIKASNLSENRLDIILNLIVQGYDFFLN